MAKISYIAETKPSNWRTIGKLWASRKDVEALPEEDQKKFKELMKKIKFTGKFGLKKKTEAGLVDMFKDINIRADESLLVRPNDRKRSENDPDFSVSVMTGEEKAAEKA